MTNEEYNPILPDSESVFEDPEALLSIALPLEREECAELVEAQNTNSGTETGLVLAKEPRSEARFDVRVLWQAFLHGIKWPQLKRQLTKEALLGHAKRHWAKVALVGTVFYFVQIQVHPASTNQTASAAVLQYETPVTPPPTTTTRSVVAPPTTSSTVLALSASEKRSFVERFVSVAQGEMKKFDIPASIILALAVVKSNYGTSSLAQQGNNYFHIGCTKNLLAEGVMNRVLENNVCYMHYENAWTSFRANSLYLQSTPYQSLRGKADVRQWAAALEQEGVVSAPTLLAIVAQHNLHHYDAL